MFNLDGFRPDAMDALVGPIFHVSIIIGIFYAWTIGYRKESKFRPGKARNMKEEFIVYGLPFWLMYATGTIKIISSVLLILGFFYPIFLKPVAAILCLVMGGAVCITKHNTLVSCSFIFISRRVYTHCYISRLGV